MLKITREEKMVHFSVLWDMFTVRYADLSPASDASCQQREAMEQSRLWDDSLQLLLGVHAHPGSQWVHKRSHGWPKSYVDCCSWLVAHHLLHV
ncbi:hypothetical protein G9C98_005180 [Cotesia typhae]|uniref:Uncharacterized protein n=1 Tax=Cotesia typhae TaxID=2053667 RepID=A0A8J5RJN1_9HYME|nr:hypothetical protein G9C98_005180 [Cotesia typhae]